MKSSHLLWLFIIVVCFFVYYFLPLKSCIFIFRSDGELRAIAEEFAFDNNKFVQTVVAAWDKLATADR